MKRFTETEKWRDSWFRRLSPSTKIAYLYILDSVDLAGVWDPDFELANFTIGEPVDWIKVQSELGDRLEMLKSGKWWLTKFIHFQYGNLSEDCRPHLAVLRLIDAHGLKLDTLSKEYKKSTGSHKDKDKDQDKDKDIGGVGESAEAIYQAYPRKEAKQSAIKAILKALDHGDVTERAAYMLSKTRAYADAVAKWPADERQYVPHPATWFNRGSFDDDPSAWARVSKLNTPLMR